MKYLLTLSPIDERDVVGTLEKKGVGGVVTFTGCVREESRGKRVTKLEYEAYPEMAQKVFAQIADEARSKFDIVDIAIHHRAGALDVGETSVVVAAAAAHRAAAFDACRFAIDRLKQIAPIWKKEHSPDGAVWVEDRP